MLLDDDLLVRRAQAGWVDAFEQLVRQHRDRVYRVALTLLGSRAEAEDVAQESLVAAWQAMPAFRGDSSVSSWLYRIVVNKSRDAQRRGRAVDLVDLHDEAVAAQLPADPDAGTVAEARARTQALRAAIAALPFDLRAPLVLREFEGCSYDEVAAILGLSGPTVRGRLARARQELVRQLRGWA